jgi:hypothetical protein
MSVRTTSRAAIQNPKRGRPIPGTKPTCRSSRRMSAVGGSTDLARGRGSKSEISLDGAKRLPDVELRWPRPLSSYSSPSILPMAVAANRLGGDSLDEHGCAAEPTNALIGCYISKTGSRLSFSARQPWRPDLNKIDIERVRTTPIEPARSRRYEASPTPTSDWASL